MTTSPPSSWISVVPIPLLSAVAGAALVLLFFADYFRRRRAEVASIAVPPTPVSDTKPSKPHASRKPNPKAHHHVSDKEQRHHHLDLNTLRGHTDAVTSLSFSPDGRNLATACSDGAVRVFRIDDVSSKSFKILRINLPGSANPTAITFSEGASLVVVAGQNFSGASLYMYGNLAKPSEDEKQHAKSSLPEIMWQHEKVHDIRSILTLDGVAATFGSADGSTIVASCSEGTDIKLWHGKSGKNLGTVDTNQLKNTMAVISPNGRFLAAAAFTADVKVWEIIYSKDGSVKEVSKAMQLKKGHKSAVTWLCFTPNSEQVITSSKDGTIRIWNINVRYHLEEDPKTLKVFPIPLHDESGSTLHYDMISLSPDGKFLAATHGSTLQWLCAETGKVLDTADKSHEGDINDIAWALQKIPMGSRMAMILATAGADKKVKLWMAPEPRFVTHIDGPAIDALTKYYSKVLPPSNTPGACILDLCSSWVSHYPKGYKQDRIIGMGMNEEELKRNPVLTEYLVQDLNVNPKLPFDDNSFDVITNVVSVDYLTKPIDVFMEMQRILKPGGQAIMSFSNRCFWTKAISIWTSTGDADHALIVGSYFHYAGGYEPPIAFDISPNPGRSDPMYIVYSRKAASA